MAQKYVSIKEFIEGFDNAKDKEYYVKKHLITGYIDYEHKIALCRSILNQSMYKNVNGKKMFVIDSPMRWMFFVFSIITSYTNIEVPEDGTKRMKIFNEIEKHDVMNTLSTVLGKEYGAFSSLLNVMVEDEIRNNDLRAMIETKIEALNLVSGKIPWEKLLSETTNNNKAK